MVPEAIDSGLKAQERLGFAAEAIGSLSVC